MSSLDNGARVEDAEFLFGSPKVSGIKGQPLPEIAVIGRSNVGKSSLINRLLGRSLARTSQKPGCTREINFFRVKVRYRNKSRNLALVDLPGFGFAKLAKVERESIGREVVEYIKGREQLRVVLLLNDVRRAPANDERAIQELCAEVGVHCLVVATKTDLLRQKERVKTKSALAKGYRLEVDDLVYTGEGEPASGLWSHVLGLVCLAE